jgi:vitamin B12 transporter
LWDSWFTTLGPVDDHDRFGTEKTWRVASAYLIRRTGTKVKATYGTGFKAPRCTSSIRITATKI